MLHSFASSSCCMVFVLLAHICKCDHALPNGSTKSLSWTTNSSLGLTDKMRTYGQGFHLTPEEEVALEKLRPLVKHDALLAFHLRDNFLVKFLRARNLDVRAAADMFKAAMEWRKERDLDGLLNANFTKWEKLFPFIISGFDKQDGPVYYILAATYDIRKSVIAGHYNTLETLFDRSYELAVRTAVAIYETTGKNVGMSLTLILDLTGFNVRQHACAGCLPIFVHVVNVYERYWPEMMRHFIFINAPRSFKILDLVRPFMSAHTASMIEVYGVDKNEWAPVLKKYVDPDQLLVRYGGTRKLNSLSSQTYGG